MQTLIDLFERFVDFDDHVAFVDRTGVRRYSYSYREFHDLALRMAQLLAENGVVRGDRVLIWGPNSTWWAVSFWGTLVAGGVAVPVDFMSDRDRAETIARLTEAKVVLQSRFKLERLTGRPSFNLEDLPYLLKSIEQISEPVRPSPADTAQLIYTSGTTGNPKGVILSHANLVTNITQISRHIPVVNADYTFVSLLPLSHMFEQMGGFFTPLYEGAQIVYLRTLKPSAIMEALAEEDVYAIIAVPRLLQLLKSSIERELEEKHLSAVFRYLMQISPRLSQKLRSLLFYPVHRKFGNHFQLFVSGGAPLDPDTFNFWKSLGFKVIEGYGLTECSPVLTANAWERQVAGSVGVALPGVELRIENKEVQARGGNIFPGYYQNEQATREAFAPEGWFRTGDLGEIDKDGWLTIKGREKELIVTGSGVNVYPDELEAVLNRIPGVRESAVIGMDRGGGEEVHAVLLPDGTGVSAEEIIRRANEQLDPLHRITGYSVWQEPEFPKTTTLKIRKFLVKEELKKGAEKGGGLGRDRLSNLLAQVTGTPVSEIREDSLLMADLGLTSIGRLELVNHLEQEFRMDMDETAITPETRVADLRHVIEAREKIRVRGHFRFWSNCNLVRRCRMVWDRIFHFPLLRALESIEVHGAEHLEQLERPVLLVCNHLSYLDQPSLMYALPLEVRYQTATAAWEEFFFKDYRNCLERLWKRFAYEYGTWFINLFPLPQTRGFSGSLRFMGKLADNGINILIFPEGAHAPNGELQPFQPGLGVIVKELGIPVLPIRIQGTNEVLPPNTCRIRRGRVTIRFGELIRFGAEEPREIVARTRQAIQRL